MFCSNCKKEISDDTKFCSYCGAQQFQQTQKAPYVENRQEQINVAQANGMLDDASDIISGPVPQGNKKFLIPVFASLAGIIVVALLGVFVIAPMVENASADSDDSNYSTSKDEDDSNEFSVYEPSGSSAYEPSDDPVDVPTNNTTISEYEQIFLDYNIVESPTPFGG